MVKLETSGVCHTDLHAARGDLPGRPRPPFVPGHEGYGTVVAVGTDVTELEVGDKVGNAWLWWACGECQYCRTGWETLCESQRNGGYSVNPGHGVLVTAVAPEPFRQAIGFARRGGTIVLIGLPPGDFPLPIFDVVLRGLTIRGSIVGTRQDMAEALDFYARGLIPPDGRGRPIRGHQRGLRAHGTRGDRRPDRDRLPAVTTADTAAATPEFHADRKVSVGTLTAMVVGSIVGSGVFVVPRRFATVAGVLGALILLLFVSNAMDFILDLTAVLAVLPYLMAAAYALKLTLRRETYYGQGRQLRTDTIIAILGIVYTAFLVYAAGPKHLLLSRLLYAPAALFYARARRERGLRIFSGPELALFGVVVMGAVIAIELLVTGTITL